MTDARYSALGHLSNGVQLALLSDHGCDYIQGYYISKPLPADELLHFLHENKAVSAQDSVVRMAGRG